LTFYTLNFVNFSQKHFLQVHFSIEQEKTTLWQDQKNFFILSKAIQDKILSNQNDYQITQKET